MSDTERNQGWKQWPVGLIIIIKCLRRLSFGRSSRVILHSSEVTRAQVSHKGYVFQPNLRKWHLNVSYSKPNQFSRSVVSDSATPWTAAHQASLSITKFWNLLRLIVLWVGDAIQPFHPVVPFSHLQSFPASGSFPIVSSSHQVAKVLEFQLQHQSFQWIFRMGSLKSW